MSRKKLKIAFIHPDLGIGGAERLVLDAASALTKQGNHDVYFLTNHFDRTHAFDELKNDEYPVHVYGDCLPRSIFGKFHALCAYIRMIYLTIIYVLFYQRYDKPDLYFVDLIPISIPILKVFGQKVVYYCHHPDLLSSTPGGKLKRFYRKPIDFLEYNATNMSDVVLVNSEYTASVFKKTFPNIDKPIQILYPTIAQSYQEIIKKPTKVLEEIIPEIQDATDSIILLSINRFHPAKKLDLAILAMQQLQKQVSPALWKRIYLIMIGGYDPQSQINASYYQTLQKLVNMTNLEQKIIFLKSPSDDIKADLLKLCDCLIYTPVNEHFGIVPLEAMTVSKPVIACNSGGPKETVEHGINGFLCEPTPESMAQFMVQILDRPTARKMGEQGKIVLENRFSYDTFAKCLNEIVINAYNNKF